MAQETQPIAALSADDRERLRRTPKVELHQHVDGSIPSEVTWDLMRHYRLNPADSLDAMRGHLEIQAGEEGTLLAYLDKMYYPLWVTQFYENISRAVEAICLAAAAAGVETLELRYAPLIHTYAGLTPRQSIRAALSGMNHAHRRHPAMKLGLIVIAMRQHGPHIAKILARQSLAEAQHLHERTGVVGFDIAGPERGNPPRLFRSAYEIARLGRLGLTAHAGEDGPTEYVWQAVDELGVERIGHGCSAARDPELLRRAIENIVRNAIRHAPAGTDVDVILDSNAARELISVRDRGPGVPEEALNRIFDAFYRVEADRNRSSGGVGLGLAIAQRAVELHNGTLRAKNMNPGLLVEIELLH